MQELLKILKSFFKSKSLTRNFFNFAIFLHIIQFERNFNVFCMNLFTMFEILQNFIKSNAYIYAYTTHARIYTKYRKYLFSLNIFLIFYNKCIIEINLFIIIYYNRFIIIVDIIISRYNIYYNTINRKIGTSS